MRGPLGGKSPNIPKSVHPLPASPMNRTETKHAESLELRRRAGDVRWWAFEPWRFRLADGSFYTPDFGVMVGERIEVHEVKGHWEEAARVRIRVAAALYPMFQFIAFRQRPKKDGGGVERTEIPSHHSIVDALFVVSDRCADCDMRQGQSHAYTCPRVAGIIRRTSK